MVQYEKAIDGLISYVNDNIIPGMNPLQEIGARIILGELYDRRNILKESMLNVGMLRTFGYIDNDGNLNIDSVFQRLKNEIEKKGEIMVSVPMYGTFKFKPNDIDTIYDYIVRS